MLPSLSFKRGTSLFLGMEALDEAGEPASLMGVDVVCNAVHEESGDTKELELVWVDRAEGRFEFWAPGDGTCTEWHLGSWRADIVYTRAGGASGGRVLVVATETMTILILRTP